MDELKEEIVHKLDVMAFLDILGLELADIIDKFDDEIEECFDELRKACS